METITRLLFEQPYIQGVLAVVALLVALAGWWRLRYEPDRARPWALAAAIVAVLSLAGQFAASLVTTDRERIESLFQKAADAVERADAPGLLALTDDNVQANGLNKERFAGYLQDVFARFRIENPNIQKMQISFEAPGAASADINAFATVHSQGMSFPASGAWRFDLSKIAGQWKIVSLQAQERVRRLP